MKLNNNKSYLIDVMCYDECRRSVLFCMPNGEMSKHLDDNDLKSYFETPIDQAISFHYDHIKQSEIDSYEKNGFSHLDLIKATLIGDTMGYEGLWDDYNYTIIEIVGIYECYWSNENNEWWYKSDDLMQKFLEVA